MLSIEQIYVGVWNEIFREHSQRLHEPVRFSLATFDGILLGEDDFELQKVPESLDPVEMDTGPADEVEVADFPDHGLFPVGGSEDMAQSGGIGSGSRGVVGGLGALLVRALVENEFTPLRAEDAELEATGETTSSSRWPPSPSSWCRFPRKRLCPAGLSARARSRFHLI